MDTGKSSLTVQFVEGHFVESYYPTIENAFSRIIRSNGQDYATEIVDTAGQVCSIAQSLRASMKCRCPLQKLLSETRLKGRALGPIAGRV